MTTPDKHHAPKPLDYAAPVRRPLRWRRLIIFAGCVLVAAVLAVAVPIVWFVIVQQRNMSLAAQHAPIVLRALKDDPRFSEVGAEPFTANNGCLLVSAAVEQGSVDEFKRIVAATNPPVFVRYNVSEIRSTTRPAD